MRRVGRILGWVLILLALAVLGGDVLASLDSGGAFMPRPLGQLWFDVDADSLNLLQAVIQRYVHPAIWEPGITTILLLPAFVVIAVPGLLLAVLCRPRPGRRRAMFY